MCLIDFVLVFVYKIYRTVYNIFYGFYKSLDIDRFVIGSGFSSSLEKYISIVFKLIIFTTIITLFFLIVFFYGLYKLSLWLCILIAFAINLTIVLPLFIVFSIVLPRFMYFNRGSVIESKIPIFLSITAFLSSAGLSLQEIFSKIIIFLGDNYKFFYVELDLIKSYIQIGIPLNETLKTVASLTPSQTFREFLLGLSSLSVVGGDIGSFVRSMFDRYVSRYELKIERAVNALNIYMEIYVAISLLIPVLAGSMAVLFVLSPIAGISFEAFMILITFILVPIPSALIVVLADAIVSKLRP